MGFKTILRSQSDFSWNLKKKSKVILSTENVFKGLNNGLSWTLMNWFGHRWFMNDCPSLFIGLFVLRLSLTWPWNNIFPNRETVTPHNLPPKPSFKALFIEPGAKDTSGVSSWGTARKTWPRGTSHETIEGVDKAGHEGPTGPWYWQGVYTITMVMVSTLVCLLSEVSISSPKLTKADIVRVVQAILARWPVYLQIHRGCIDEHLWDKSVCLYRLV